MDFAKKLLSKYGWKEGDGLGKNSDGIAKPLKANLKFDNQGLGADQAASDFNNHWWERVFNEAASNVDVQEHDDGDGVRMDLKDHNETVEITTKGYSMQKLKKTKSDKNDVMYNNFLQTAQLTQAGSEIELADRVKSTDIEVRRYKQLTDEELFKACGGRTAHKGARHGLKLSGKLARLEMQEKELLAKMLGKLDDSKCETKATFAVTEQEVVEKSKKKKRKHKELMENNDEIEAEPIVEVKTKKTKNNIAEIENITEVKSKKQLKKEAKAKAELDTTSDLPAKPKKTKKKHEKNEETLVTVETVTVDVTEKPKKKKKKKDKVIENET